MRRNNYIGFQCYLHRNQNWTQTYLSLQDFARRKELFEVDMLTVCFMSHGHFGNIVCTDGEKFKVEEVFQMFDDVRCKALRGKPKFYMNKTCRGFENAKYCKDGVNRAEILKEFQERYPKEFKTLKITLLKETQEQFPEAFLTELQSLVLGSDKLTDVLVAYSVMPGFASLRHEENGSPYIKILVKNFCEHAHNTDLRRLMSKVCRETTTGWEGTDETEPGEVVDRSFDKLCFLNPGIWGEK